MPNSFGEALQNIEGRTVGSESEDHDTIKWFAEIGERQCGTTWLGSDARKLRTREGCRSPTRRSASRRNGLSARENMWCLNTGRRGRRNIGMGDDTTATLTNAT